MRFVRYVVGVYISHVRAMENYISSNFLESDSTRYELPSVKYLRSISGRITSVWDEPTCA